MDVARYKVSKHVLLIERMTMFFLVFFFSASSDHTTLNAVLSSVSQGNKFTGTVSNRFYKLFKFYCEVKQHGLVGALESVAVEKTGQILFTDKT